MGTGRTRRARVEIEGKDELSPAAKKAETGIAKLARSLNLKLIAAAAATTIAIRRLTRFIGESVTASGEQEAAYNALTSALSPLGDAADDVSQSLARQAAELQKVTTFGDEVTLRAQATIAAFVKEEEAIKAATIAAQDLAVGAFKGQLQPAADLIAKTLGSTTNALSRYGIEVEGAVGSSERLASLTSAINEAFGNRARDEVDTYRGAIAQLSNAWGDLQEQLGDAITQNVEIREAIKSVTDFLSDPSTANAIAKFFNDLVAGAREVIGWFRQLRDWVDALRLSFDATAEEGGVAWERLAARAGKSVQEIQAEIEGAVDQTRSLNENTRLLRAAFDESSDAIDRTTRVTAQATEKKIAAAEATEKAADETEAETQIIRINTNSQAENIQAIQELVRARESQIAVTRVAVEVERELGAASQSSIGQPFFPGLSGGQFTVTIPTVRSIERRFRRFAGQSAASVDRTIG